MWEADLHSADASIVQAVHKAVATIALSIPGIPVSVLKRKGVLCCPLRPSPYE